jgi:hypothetical protein
MRYAALLDCLQILKHFRIDPSKGTGIDVGGTEIVYLDGTPSPNPLLQLNKSLFLLDKGFTIEHLGTTAHQVIDFLDKNQISHLEGRFDLVFSFDTLEHVPNLFLFCENMIFVAKRGGYIYVATVFEWPYHPSSPSVDWCCVGEHALDDFNGCRSNWRGHPRFASRGSFGLSQRPLRRAEVSFLGSLSPVLVDSQGLGDSAEEKCIRFSPGWVG